MRTKQRRTRGVSLGTVATLTLMGIVLVGCAILFPKLMGDIKLRVDPQTVSVAISNALQGHGEQQTDSSLNESSLMQTQDTLPPMALSTSVPTPTQPVIQTVSLTATGTISVDASIQKACTSEAGYAFGPLFEQLASAFQSDMNLATLENLVIAKEKLTDVNMPADALTAIRDSGINVLCTGFFDAFNSGVSGLATTVSAITERGMTAYGAYSSLESRKHVTTILVNGTTVALLSFQSELSAAGKKKTNKDEQAFVIAPLTLPTISADITAARAAGAKIVIVSLCWGKKGASTPSATQKEMAQGIANAGADVILGTHSGALQPVTLLTATRADGSTHQTLCAYSLGNLLLSDRSDREAISGALLHITMNYNLADDSISFDALTYTPTYVWRGKIDGRTNYRVLRSNAEPPEFVDEDQSKVMARCLKVVRDSFENSPVTEAQ